MRGEFGIEVAEDSDANGLAHASIVLEGAIGSDYLSGAKARFFCVRFTRRWKRRSSTVVPACDSRTNLSCELEPVDHVQQGIET